jgi:hypothetical protein
VPGLLDSMPPQGAMPASMGLLGLMGAEGAGKAPPPARAASPAFADIGAFSPQEQAALNYHRQHLQKGTFQKNKDGSITTFYGTVIDVPGGAMIIPAYWNGKTVTDIRKAVELAKKSGIQWPRYKSVNDALAAEQRMHAVMEQDIAGFQATKP